MNKTIPIKKFSLRLIVFSVIIAGLSVLAQLLLKRWITPALPFIVLFFFVISLLTLYIVLRDDGGKIDRRFVSSYMLSRIVKFFSCLIFILLYVWFCPPSDRIPFVVAFFVIYFAYSVFEIVVLKKENDSVHSIDNNNKTDK